MERLCDVFFKLNLSRKLPTVSSYYLVAVFSPALLDPALALYNNLREQVRGEIYLDYTAKLDKQFKYANNKRIPYVLIIGPEEQSKNQVTLKNMQTGKQTTYAKAEIVTVIKSLV